MDQTQLPDLSVAPAIATKEEAGQGFKDGELDAILAAAVGEEVTEERAEGIIAKAEEFEKRLEEGQKKPARVTPPELPEESAREKAKRKAEERLKEKEKEKTPPKAKGKRASQARMALALTAPAVIAGVVKPQAPPQKPKGGAKDAKGAKGKEKEEEEAVLPPPAAQEGEEDEGGEGARTPTQKPSGSSVNTDAVRRPSVSRQEEALRKAETDDELWEENPEEDFPAVAPSVDLEQYEELSVQSAHIEGLAEDISAVGRQVTELVVQVSRLSGHLARLDERVVNIEKDRTQFASSLLDRVRQNERALGNRPPTATPSAALSVTPPTPDVPSGSGQEQKVLSAAEKKAMMAALRASRAK